MITQLFIDEPTKDYYEILLHHIMQLTLSLGYISANTLPYGTVIMLLHDQSDIGVALSRTLNFAGSRILYSGTTLVISCILWFWQRLFGFGCIIAYLYSHKFPTGREHLQPYLTCSWIFLFIHILLNIYWGYYIVSILIKAVTGKKNKKSWKNQTYKVS